MGCGDNLNPFDGDFWSSGNFLDPGGGLVGDALGLHGPGAFAAQPWNIPQYVKEDWRAIKHMLVPDMRKDREAMVNSALANRRIVYGKTRVSGSLVYAETTGGSNEFLHLVIALCNHTVAGMDELYLDDRLASEFGDKVRYEFFDGTQVTACATLVTASAGTWTADHKLLGVCYLYLRLTYDDTNFSTGIPTPKVVLRGKNDIFDPRTSTTGWSDNVILCIRDYMLMSVSLGGMGCDGAEIDDAGNLNAQATICDTLVAKDNGTGTEPRYTLNGVLEVAGTPASNIRHMLQACAGEALYSQGVWRVFVAAYSAPVATLDESWLNGGITFSMGSDKNTRVNTVNGAFVNPADHWANSGFPTIQIPAYLAEDDEELAADLQLDMVTSAATAQRLGKLVIERSRRGMTVQYPCNLKAFGLAVNDVVAINNSPLGWAAKEFRVLSWEFSTNGGVVLGLGEEDANIYDWVPGDVTPLATPPLTNLPDPWHVAAPNTLSVTEQLYTGNVASVVKCKAIFTWTPGDAQSSLYDVAVDGVYLATVTGTAFEILDMLPGDHTFTVTASNTIAKSLPATISSHVNGKTAAPANVGGFGVEITRGQMRLYWTPVADLDVAGYSIQIGEAWDDGDNTLLVADYAGTSYPWTPDRIGTITFLIKARDTSGNWSVAAAVLVYEVTSPGPITALQQSVIDNIVTLTWQAGVTGTFPIAYWEVLKGNDLATAVVLAKKYVTGDLISETVSGTVKYWIVPVDVAGLRGQEAGIYAKVDQPPDYILKTQVQLDWLAGTCTNAGVELGKLIIPISTTETIDQAYSSQGWTTEQDAINAGAEYAAEIVPTTGSYEEIIDTGATIPTAKATVTVTRNSLGGSPTMTCDLYVSTSAVGPWTQIATGAYEGVGQAFRYLKVVLTATSNGGFFACTEAAVRVDVKERNLVCQVNVSDTAGSGTEVTFASLGIAPIDVVGITAQAPYTNTAADPIDARINFTDTANPSSFRVLAWDKNVNRCTVNGVVCTIRYIA